MKKYVVWLLIVFLISSAAIPNITKNIRPSAVNKTISLVIYKSIDYSAGAYDSTTVQLIINIDKVEGTKHAAIWNQQYKTTLLRDYPVKDSATVQTITIPQFNNKQQVEITYTRIYNSVGYQLKLKNRVCLYQPFLDSIEISI